MPRSESVGDLISLISPRRLRVGHDPTEMRLRMETREETDAEARIFRAIDYHRHWLDRNLENGQDVDYHDYRALEDDAQKEGVAFAERTEEQVEDDIAAAIGAYGYDYVRSIVDRVGPATKEGI